MKIEQVDKILNDDTDRQNNYKLYRAALKSSKLVLTDKMQAILNAKTRRNIPLANLIVSSVVDRLLVKEIETEDAALKEAAQRWLKQNRWERFQKHIFGRAVRDGDSYVLVRWNPIRSMAEYIVKDAYDGYTGAHVVYHPDTNEVLFGINQWVDGDWMYRDIFYPATIEHYKRHISVPQDPNNTWEKAGPIGDWTDLANQPLGVALIHFKNGDQGGQYGESDLAPILQLQQDINEVMLDARATSRLQGWPRQYVAGERITYLTDAYDQTLLGMNGEPIKSDPSLYLEPGAILNFRSAETKVGQLDAASPAGHISLIELQLRMVSLSTGVPMHQFTGTWPSGDALVRAETRLLSKIEDAMSSFATAIEDLIFLTARMYTAFSGESYNTQDTYLEVTYFDPLPESESLILQRIQNIGALTYLSPEGQMIQSRFSPEFIAEELARIEKLKAEQLEQQTALMEKSAEIKAASQPNSGDSNVTGRDPDQQPKPKPATSS